MKIKLSIIAFFLLSSNVLGGQEIISILDGIFMFKKLDEIILWDEMPNFSNIHDRDDYLRGKIVLRILITDEKYYRNIQPTMLSSSLKELLSMKSELTQSDYLDLFELNTKYLFTKYLPWADIQQSYISIRKNNRPLGESYFRVASDGLLAPTTYTYTVSVVIGKKIITMYLSYYDHQDLGVAKQLTDYFVDRGGYIYWTDRNAIDEFYQRLSTDAYKTMPKNLQILRDARDLILATMKTGNDSIGSYIKATHRTIDNLRLRTSADISSSIITTLRKDVKVQVLDVGKTDKIDGIIAPWVKIISPTGYTGWCFSGYLELL
jgi:hypothetical protein